MGRTLDCREQGARAAALAVAARAAKNGKLVAAPAESGYVVVADAFSQPGVSALRVSKGLSTSTTLGVLVAGRHGVHGIAAGLGGVEQDLIAAFWPGQLSLVVRVQPSLAWTVPTGRAVVRMPLHPVLLALVEQVGPCVYSGIESTSRDQAAVLLDCGERPAGPPSTVVDVTGESPVLVRAGAVAVDDLRRVVPQLLAP